jgi:hypothetical protein
MRKIESEMNSAIIERINWNSDNTRVEYEEGNCVSRVYLYGNKIAEIGESWIRLWDGGQQSAITKSRLNAILSALGCGHERVYQKAGVWMISICEAFKIEYKIVPFTSGMFVE